MDADKLAKLFVKNLNRFLGARRPAWLAKRSGVAQSTIGRLLGGQMRPSFETMAPLADALEVHPAEFLIDEGKSLSVERKVSLEEDQVAALKKIMREMVVEEQLENPDAVVLAKRLPKDILEALTAWKGDWNFIRAALDLPEPAEAPKKKGHKATS